MLKRIGKYLVALLLAFGLSAPMGGCGPMGRALARGVATAAVYTAAALITLAVWYSITRPVTIYVHTDMGAQRLAVLPPGARLYIMAYSADRRWVRVRTPDGRVGWVPSHVLRGAHRIQ